MRTERGEGGEKEREFQVKKRKEEEEGYVVRRKKESM